MYQFRFDELSQQTYNKSLKCFPVIMMGGKERVDVDRGGKIILPGSALEHLTRLHIQFPMLFKLTNKSKGRETHCGVLEFVAEEGRCYLPYWMMKNLLLNEGEIIQVQYTNLGIAKFAKFQPQSVDFLEISNPKAVLENALRNFATLTKGDVVSINYNEKDYELCILETRPGDAVSIIECDMDVDFAPPVGYQEPDYKAQALAEKNKATTSGYNYPQRQPPQKQPVHEGYRLDGKTRKSESNSTSEPMDADYKPSLSGTDEENQRGMPDFDYKIGLLRLNRVIVKPEPEQEVKKEIVNTGQKLKNIGKTVK